MDEVVKFGKKLEKMAASDTIVSMVAVPWAIKQD